MTNHKEAEEIVVREDVLSEILGRTMDGHVVSVILGVARLAVHGYLELSHPWPSL